MRRLILLVVVLVIAGGGYYYYTFSDSEVSTTSYEYIKIEKGNIKKTVSATGKIIPTSTLEGTLIRGDFLFVSKYNYGSNVPNTPLILPFMHTVHMTPSCVAS